MDKEATRSAVGLAITILEDLPEDYRPVSNIEHMRGILNGETSGRDEYVLIEALSTVLAFRAATAMSATVCPDSSEARAASVVGMSNRMNEFTALFESLAHYSPSTVAYCFEHACNRLGAMANSRERH